LTSQWDYSAFLYSSILTLYSFTHRSFTHRSETLLFRYHFLAILVHVHAFIEFLTCYFCFLRHRSPLKSLKSFRGNDKPFVWVPLRFFPTYFINYYTHTDSTSDFGICKDNRGTGSNVTLILFQEQLYRMQYYINKQLQYICWLYCQVWSSPALIRYAQNYQSLSKEGKWFIIVQCCISGS